MYLMHSTGSRRWATTWLRVAWLTIFYLSYIKAHFSSTQP